MNKKILLLSLIFSALIIINFVNAGCCFNPTNGLCSENTEEDKCTPFGGEYTDGECKGLQKCQTGCCVLGSKTQLATIAQCNLLSNKLGFQFPENYREDMTESECINLNRSQVLGACVTKGQLSDENNCNLITETECKGVFYKNTLCTDKKLNATCKKTTNTVLVAGRDEVYFVDSCGNVANIYDSTKINDENYWGQIYSKKDSCGANQSNANSKTCGNCFYNLSSTGRVADSTTATPTYGKYICADLSCKEDDGTVRQNGEAWCTFDNRAKLYLSHQGREVPIGEMDYPNGRGSYGYNGVEVPIGSRFFRRVCTNGKIEIEPCADFRGERCLHNKCVLNDWRSYLDIEKKSDCNAQDGFFFGADPNCGKIKAGSDLWNKPGLAAYLCKNPNSNAKNVDTPICVEGGEVINLDELSQTALNALIPQYGGSTAAIGVGAEFTSKVSSDFQDMGFGHCFSEIPGGFDFWNYAGKKSSPCSKINFESTLTFKTNSGYWYLQVDKSEANYFGNAALLKSNIGFWSRYNVGDGYILIGDPEISKELREIWSGTSSTLSLNPDWDRMFSAQCKNVGDCGNKNNWLVGKIDQVNPNAAKTTGKVVENLESEKTTENEEGFAFLDDIDITKYQDTKESKITGKATSTTTCSDMGRSTVSCTKNTGALTITCIVKFECGAYQAKSVGSCESCGTDGLPCSQYRCRALGKNCEYAQAGDGTGYCKSSADKTPPIINFTKYPTSPVEPYGAVQFEIKTNEVTSCKFDLKNNSYENMTYDFGEEAGNTHSVILYPPTYSKGLDENLAAYGILKKDGKYTLNVQCADGLGNIGSAYKNFEVMTTPDKKAPRILGFNPLSGSFIQYNTTSKKIVIKTDEPVECRWSQKNEDFKLMKNNFTCDDIISPDGLTKGYFCAGNVTNVTLVIDSESKFYIRCKDQPWLEGIEDNFYQRNVQTESTEYILRPSQKLEIRAISPSGKTIIGPGEQLQLRVSTYSGAFSGKANCSFIVPAITGDNRSVVFSVTNTNLNKNNLSLGDGTYSGEIICKDVADNVVKGNIGFSLLIDKKAPILNKIYEYGKNLKIRTNENSLCYYALNKKAGCLENIENLTLMEGVNKEHNADWAEGNSYYIKCADYFGNYDKVCGSIVKAY